MIFVKLPSRRVFLISHLPFKFILCHTSLTMLHEAFLIRSFCSFSKYRKTMENFSSGMIRQSNFEARFETRHYGGARSVLGGVTGVGCSKSWKLSQSLYTIFLPSKCRIYNEFSIIFVLVVCIEEHTHALWRWVNCSWHMFAHHLPKVAQISHDSRGPVGQKKDTKTPGFLDEASIWLLPSWHSCM